MITYHVTSRVWLHLEEFYGQGITSDDARGVIERMADPGSSSLNLSCESSGCNGNWIVGTQSIDPRVHAELVRRIAVELGVILRNKKAGG